MKLNFQLGLIKEIAKRIIKPSVSKINFSVTYACNQKCSTCGIWSTYVKTPLLKLKELTLEEYKEIFQKNKNVLWMSFTGGEPFLRKDFANIVGSAVKMTGVKIINIPTNGQIRQKIVNDVKEILKSPKDFLLFISISLNGDPSVHNKISQTPNSFNRAIITLQKLIEISKNEKRLIINIGYTFSKQNSGKLQDLVENLRQNNINLGLEKYVFTVAQNSSYYNIQSKKEFLTPKNTLTEELAQISTYYNSINILKNPMDIIRYSFLKMLTAKKTSACVALSHSCFVDPFGEVYPCIFMNHKLGNLKKENYDIEKIFKKSKNIKKKVGDCEGCLIPCETYQAIIFKPWILTKLIK